MRHTIWCAALALAALTLGAAGAQDGVETVPDDTVRQYAPRVVEAVGKNHPNAAVKVDAYAERAVAYRADQNALMLIPDRTLAPKTVEGAGEKVAPVGLAVLRNLTPVVEGKNAPADRVATLTPDGEGRDVALLFLGVRLDAAKPVLEVYSAGEKPLLRAPLAKKAETDAAARPLTARVARIDRDARQADLVVTVAGTYEANLRIGANGQ